MAHALKFVLGLVVCVFVSPPAMAEDVLQSLPPELREHADPRQPRDDDELRFWLGNLLRDHRFTLAEASAATGLSTSDIEAAVARLGIDPATTKAAVGGGVKLLPYPGGRHPRIGFLDGAVKPQRETKVSVFAPWDGGGYVVIDVPEAIWCQHGLLYLAHTHVPTMWTERKLELEKLEWNRADDGRLAIERRLPNGVIFGSQAIAQPDGVRLECWLRNGSDETLTGLRVQMCAMLKGLAGFDAQTNDNKLFRGDYACCHAVDRQRWAIMAWTPNHRTWGNPPCPCLHSDPQFPACAPGETVRAVGRLWFYEGHAIDEKLRELESSNWREGTSP